MEKSLNKSLEVTLPSKKKLEDDLCTYKDEQMGTLYKYNDRANEQVAFLYFNLDLSQLDLLKVVWGGQLVEK